MASRFDHPAAARPPRRSVIREAAGTTPRRPPTRGANAQNGGQTAGQGAGQFSFSDFFARYKAFVLLGAGALVVVIVHQIYSRRLSANKTPEQVSRGMNALASGPARATLQVDPDVIETLQQQVLQYQAHVEQLETAINQRDLQLAQMAQIQQQPQHQPPGVAQQPNPFAGLHGDPGMFPPGPPAGPPPHMMGPMGGPMGQMGGPVGPMGMGGPMGPVGPMGQMGPGQGGGQMPGARPDFSKPLQGAMGAFSNEPGLDSLGPLSGGIQMNQGGGGGQFTPL